MSSTRKCRQPRGAFSTASSKSISTPTQTRAHALRIAVLASPVSPLRPAQLGGAQAFICDLARGLTQRGHEVTLHCTEGSEVPGVQLALVPQPDDATAALVMPGGAEPPLAPGVAAAIARMFGDIRDLQVDAVSQHAFDAPAFEAADGLP